MEIDHIDHIVRAAAGLLNVNKLLLTGIAAMARTIRAPSMALARRIEEAACVDVLVTGNITTGNDPGPIVDLLNRSLGESSPFHQRFGYYLSAEISWEAMLPTGWSKRLEYLNFPLSRLPHILVVSPPDILLGRVARAPDPLLMMDLMLGSLVSAETLLERLDAWKLPDHQKSSIRHQIRVCEQSVLEIRSQLLVESQQDLVDEEGERNPLWELPKTALSGSLLLARSEQLAKNYSTDRLLKDEQEAGRESKVIPITGLHGSRRVPKLTK